VDTLSTSEEENGAEAAREPRERTKTREIPLLEAVSPQKKGEVADMKKVVLVDDNPMDARLISRILQMSRPLQIKQVQAGQEAIKVIQAEDPDLIILDLMIPDKSGFQILKELRQDKKLDMIPVIVITSKDLSEAEQQVLLSNDVLSLWQKGKLDREKLMAQIQAQLDGPSN
jgi:CheY-like chemotaxis protein